MRTVKMETIGAIEIATWRDELRFFRDFFRAHCRFRYAASVLKGWTQRAWRIGRGRLRGERHFYVFPICDTAWAFYGHKPFKAWTIAELVALGKQHMDGEP